MASEEAEPAEFRALSVTRHAGHDGLTYHRIVPAEPSSMVEDYLQVIWKSQEWSGTLITSSFPLERANSPTPPDAVTDRPVETAMGRDHR